MGARGTVRDILRSKQPAKVDDMTSPTDTCGPFVEVVLCDNLRSDWFSALHDESLSVPLVSKDFRFRSVA